MAKVVEFVGDDVGDTSTSYCPEKYCGSSGHLIKCVEMDSFSPFLTNLDIMELTSNVTRREMSVSAVLVTPRAGNSGAFPSRFDGRDAVKNIVRQATTMKINV